MSLGYKLDEIGGEGGGEDDEEGGFFCAEPEDDMPIVVWPEPLMSVTRDWNEEFQTLLHHSLSDSETEVERAARLRQLCHDFAEEAQRIGVMIIKELFLPPNARRIQARTHELGGLAGGEKFIHSNIFFKLAVDRASLYGGDAFAKKAAEHELKGLMALLDCRVKGLHTALMALVSYRGHTLIAQSILPVCKTSLLYGSNDGGQTVVNTSKELSHKMEIAGKLLNLKGHYVQSRGAVQQRAFLYGPADLEGHLGTDSRFYVIDTARCFPPTAPSEHAGGSHTSTSRFYLYRLFRPEFVKRWRVPLCSDTYSLFAKEGQDEHRAEVVAATANLELELVPAFAHHLDASANEWGTLAAELPHLVAEAHLRGINVRYFLLVYCSTRNTRTRRLLATEIASRLICRSITDRWRSLKSSEDTKYVEVLIDVLNCLFAAPPDGEQYFKLTILPSLFTVFVPPSAVSLSFSPPSSPPSASVIFDQRDVSRPDLLARVCAKLHASLALDLSSSASLEAVTKGQMKLDASHLRSLQAVVKHTNRISFEEGTALVRLAMSRPAGEESIALLKRACAKFAESLQIRPGDHTSLYNWGIALQQLAQQSSEPVASELRQQCSEKFERALRLRPRDWKALHKWGTALLEHALSDRVSDEARLPSLRSAAEKLERAVQLHTRDFAVVYNAGRAQLALARALGSSKPGDAALHLASATEHFQRALTYRPGAVDALLNLGVTLAKRARAAPDLAAQTTLFNEAFEVYARAVQVEPANPELRADAKSALRHLLQAGDEYQRVLQAGDSPVLLGALSNLGVVLECIASMKKHKEQANQFAAFARVYCQTMDALLQRKDAQQQLSFGTVSVLAEQSSVSGVRDVAMTLLNKYQIKPSATSGKSEKQTLSSIKRLSLSTSPPASPSQSRAHLAERTRADSNSSTGSSSSLALSTSPRSSSGPPSTPSTPSSSVRLRSILVIDAIDLIEGEVIGPLGFELVRVKRARAPGQVLRVKRGGEELALRVLRSDSFNVSRSLTVPECSFVLTPSRVRFAESSGVLEYESVCAPFTGAGLMGEEHVQFYSAGVLLALEAYHAAGQVYWDFTSANVILDSTGYAVLLPYMPLIEVKSTAPEELHDYTLDLAYFAPELLSHELDWYQYHSFSSNMWSFGVFIHHRLTGRLPEGDARQSKLQLSPSLSPVATSLLIALLSTDPASRPTASSLRRHEFFARIDWSRLAERKLDPPFKPAVFSAIRVPNGEMSDTVFAPNVPNGLAGFTLVERAPTIHAQHDTLTKQSKRT